MRTSKPHLTRTTKNEAAETTHFPRLTSSLKVRAANASKATGVPTGELLERYYHRCLLARVFLADGENWVLKGGQALLVRWPKARYSTYGEPSKTPPSTKLYVP
ncbi:hypothetical protein [Kibdelosporangium aridum]|uniref:hypothetical protein n=1 Tax=Kibdelosporangium aridum TaxID=2030 RepID=UPI000F7A064A|nr:hypothetical protein [Kibdelosporangium aridum]